MSRSLALNLDGEAYQRWACKLHRRRLSCTCRLILREEARPPRLTRMKPARSLALRLRMGNASIELRTFLDSS